MDSIHKEGVRQLSSFYFQKIYKKILKITNNLQKNYLKYANIIRIIKKIDKICKNYLHLRLPSGIILIVIETWALNSVG